MAVTAAEPGGGPGGGAPTVEVVHVKRALTLGALVFIMFFTVSGGAYGLEDLVGSSGAGLALLLLVLTPIFWSLPTALMVAELATAMPVEGGFYYWVKKAMGPSGASRRAGGPGSPPGSTWRSTRCCSSTTPRRTRRSTS